MSAKHLWNDTNGETEVLGEQPVEGATVHSNLSHGLELNPGLRGDRPATNRLHTSPHQRLSSYLPENTARFD
jgi:hypothetical protein